MLFRKEDAVDRKVIRTAGKKEGLKSYQKEFKLSKGHPSIMEILS